MSLRKDFSFDNISEETKRVIRDSRMDVTLYTNNQRIINYLISTTLRSDLDNESKRGVNRVEIKVSTALNTVRMSVMIQSEDLKLVVTSHDYKSKNVYKVLETLSKLDFKLMSVTVVTSNINSIAMMSDGKVTVYMGNTLIRLFKLHSEYDLSPALKVAVLENRLPEEYYGKRSVYN